MFSVKACLSVVLLVVAVMLRTAFSKVEARCLMFTFCHIHVIHRLEEKKTLFFEGWPLLILALAFSTALCLQLIRQYSNAFSRLIDSISWEYYCYHLCTMERDFKHKPAAHLMVVHDTVSNQNLSVTIIYRDHKKCHILECWSFIWNYCESSKFIIYSNLLFIFISKFNLSNHLLRQNFV